MLGQTIRLDSLWQDGRWITPAFVELDKNGCLKSIGTEGSADQIVSGWGVPCIDNAHSHAFQYAMVGMGEWNPADGGGDFWSWRQRMYQLALSISPEEMEAVATVLYQTMKNRGYRSVVEFHYLHHDQNGDRYDDPLEHCHRLVSAAETASLPLTLVPVYYRLGNFGRDAEKEQKRFCFYDRDEYIAFYERLNETYGHHPWVTLGAGIHSLRAAEAAEMGEIVAATQGPFHIHIAEQVKEVDDCLSYYGKRPVEWLLDEFEVNQRWNLVHATHLSAEEVERLGGCGATVVLCPSTEANLGDGLFPLATYLQLGGRIAIGSDSHIGLDPLEEVRWLDYGQRLTHLTRSLGKSLRHGSADELWRKVLAGGRSSCGRQRTEGSGDPFACMIIDGEDPMLHSPAEGSRLSTLVYHGRDERKVKSFAGGHLYNPQVPHEKDLTMLESIRRRL